MGEIRTKTWFEGVDSLRFFRPTSITPDSIHANRSTAAPPHFTAGTSIPLGWTPPSGLVGSRHDVWLSRDMGAHWYAIALNLTSPTTVWTVPSSTTTNAILGIVVRDTSGLVGSWTSAPFEIKSTGGGGSGGGGSGGSGGGGGGGHTDPGIPGVASIAFTNPARGGLDLRLSLPKAGHVTVTLFDIRGAVVARIASENRPAGVHLLHWSASSGGRSLVSPGVYFLRADTPTARLVRRVVLLR
jgi:hypothetical protein